MVEKNALGISRIDKDRELEDAIRLSFISALEKDGWYVEDLDISTIYDINDDEVMEFDGLVIAKKGRKKAMFALETKQVFYDWMLIEYLAKVSAFEQYINDFQSSSKKGKQKFNKLWRLLGPFKKYPSEYCIGSPTFAEGVLDRAVSIRCSHVQLNNDQFISTIFL